MRYILFTHEGIQFQKINNSFALGKTIHYLTKYLSYKILSILTLNVVKLLLG